MARGQATTDPPHGGSCVPTPSPASILTYFRDLPDPRRQTKNKNKKHRLLDLLVVALYGTIAGCPSAVELEAYGHSKEAWLKTFLELPNGIPSHETFSRVFQLLDPRKFHACFTKWVQALHELTRGEVVSIDGKTLRRSFDSARDLPAWHRGGGEAAMLPRYPTIPRPIPIMRAASLRLSSRPDERPPVVLP